jgi:hypothetical protein
MQARHVVRRRATALVLTAALGCSVAVNAALLLRGPLHARVTEAFEALTGTTPVARRQADEIATLEARLATERAALERSYAKFAELSNSLILERETRRNIRERYVVLSDELQSVKRANDALRAALDEAGAARP